MHKVIKPFPFSADGISVETLATGTERNFGRLTDGLVAAGYIAPVQAAVEEPELPSAVEIESPAEEEHEEDLAPPAPAGHHTARRGRRRAAE